MLACESFALLHEVRVFGVCTLDMVHPVYANISQFRWNLQVKLILRDFLRSTSLGVIHETRWVSKFQDVPFQMSVHRLKAARRDPSVVDPQIDEEVFRTMIRSCEKVEQGFMVDLRRVIVLHDD